MEYKLQFLVFYFFAGLLIAQDYDQVDATIELYPKTVKTAEELSYFISRDFSTEDTKVRAIYGWLIQNVSYDPAEYKSFDYSFATYREGNKKEAKSRANIINKTLQTGKAVCEGYAMTFEKLCQLQGINNYLVRGDTKTHFKDIGRPFGNNHIWNVVQIEGDYFLFDPTWGAGKYTDRFIKEPSYYYYKTKPTQFIKTHYPTLFEDAFLTEIISKETFSKQPIYIDPSLPLADYKTSTLGRINSMQDESDLQFGFQTSSRNIAYAYDGKKTAITLFDIREQEVHLSIPLQLGAKTLLIYIDDTPVLGYVIN